MIHSSRAARPLSVCLAVALVFAGAALAPLCAWGQQAGSPEPRQFAPGVLTTIPPTPEPQEMTSVHSIVEIRSNDQLRWRPEVIAPSRTLYSKAETARIRRDVWCLEFSFKPLRMIWVDVPRPDGQVERTLVWYLVYAVRNTGEGIAPVQGEDGLIAPQTVDVGEVRFSPHFVLKGHDQGPDGQPLYREYLDRIIPAALEPIRRRETPGRELLTTVEMARRPIPVSEGRQQQRVWGVAMWEGVDPEMDFFSVFVRGLTNAYRWEDPRGAYQAGDPPGRGRLFARKTLQLNFWRPGDQYLQHENEVRFGVAPGKASLYGDDVSAGLAYLWVYR